MNDQNTQTEQAQPAANPTPEVNKPYTRNWKKWIPAYILIAVVLYGGVYLALSSKENSDSYSVNNITPTPTQSATPTTTVSTAPTSATTMISDWKTYSNKQYKYSFKYPTDYIIQESAPDFFNIYNGPGNMGMSIDARLAGNYADFSNAVNSTKKDLVNPIVTNLDNGVKISGKIGPGYREGADIIIVLYKLNNAAIEIERSNDLIPLEIFNKILSTFKFTN